MGNVQASTTAAINNNNTKTTRRRAAGAGGHHHHHHSHHHSSSKNNSAATTNSSIDRPLEEHDLDDIYEFIRHMKQTNVGGNMLEEFVLKQARETGEFDDCGPTKPKSMDVPPINHICIIQEKPGDEKQQQQRYRPAVSPSA